MEDFSKENFYDFSINKLTMSMKEFNFNDKYTKYFRRIAIIDKLKLQKSILENKILEETDALKLENLNKELENLQEKLKNEIESSNVVDINEDILPAADDYIKTIILTDGNENCSILTDKFNIDFLIKNKDKFKIKESVNKFFAISGLCKDEEKCPNDEVNVNLKDILTSDNVCSCVTYKNYEQRKNIKTFCNQKASDYCNKLFENFTFTGKEGGTEAEMASGLFFNDVKEQLETLNKCETIHSTVSKKICVSLDGVKDCSDPIKCYEANNLLTNWYLKKIEEKHIDNLELNFELFKYENEKDNSDLVKVLEFCAAPTCLNYKDIKDYKKTYDKLYKFCKTPLPDLVNLEKGIKKKLCKASGRKFFGGEPIDGCFSGSECKILCNKFEDKILNLASKRINNNSKTPIENTLKNTITELNNFLIEDRDDRLEILGSEWNCEEKIIYNFGDGNLPLPELCDKLFYKDECSQKVINDLCKEGINLAQETKTINGEESIALIPLCEYIENIKTASDKSSDMNKIGKETWIQNKQYFGHYKNIADMVEGEDKKNELYSLIPLVGECKYMENVLRINGGIEHNEEIVCKRTDSGERCKFYYLSLDSLIKLKDNPGDTAEIKKFESNKKNFLKVCNKISFIDDRGYDKFCEEINKRICKYKSSTPLTDKVYSGKMAEKRNFEAKDGYTFFNNFTDKKCIDEIKKEEKTELENNINELKSKSNCKNIEKLLNASANGVCKNIYEIKDDKREEEIELSAIDEFILEKIAKNEKLSNDELLKKQEINDKIFDKCCKKNINDKFLILDLIFKYELTFVTFENSFEKILLENYFYNIITNLPNLKKYKKDIVVRLNFLNISFPNGTGKVISGGAKPQAAQVDSFGEPVTKNAFEIQILSKDEKLQGEIQNSLNKDLLKKEDISKILKEVKLQCNENNLNICKVLPETNIEKFEVSRKNYDISEGKKIEEDKFSKIFNWKYIIFIILFIILVILIFK